MKLLANENFPLDSVLYLKEKGYDIIGIGVDFSGISDKQVLTIAQEQDRIILTFDRDYGMLIFKESIKPKAGVIYLRLDKYESVEPGQIIERILSSENFDPTGALSVFDGTILRQRKF